MKTINRGRRGLIPLSSFAAALMLFVAVPVATATTYYVSPSGSDSNNGTSPSSPWQSIAKVNAATFTGGDSLLFEGGETFTGSIKFARARVTSTPSSKFTVGAYGTGRPTIVSTLSNINSYAISVEGVSGIVIQDLIVRPGPTSAQNGILVRTDNSSNPVPNDITIQGCDVGGFHYAPTNFGAEIFVNGYWGSLNNINILDNVLHGLNGPSSPDDNGFSSLGNGKNITNLTVQGNIVYDIGGTATGGPLSGSLGNGILANGVDGGVLQDNIVHDCGGNTDTCGGPGGIWAYNSNDVTIQFNEVYRMQPLSYSGGCDWSAYDLDGGTTNCVVQYNYSHDNFGPGLLAYVDGTWGPNVFRYNISENDNNGIYSGGHGPVSIAGSKVGGVLQIYNNTIYDGSDHSTENTRKVLYGPYTSGTWGVGSMIKNNIFYIASRDKYNRVDVIYFPYLPQNNLEIDNNVYYNTVAATPRWRWGGTNHTSLSAYQTATGHDANSLLGDPLLVNPGTGGTLTWDPTAATGPQPEPAGYGLQASSPLFGLGADLGSITPTAGPRDYYNYATPNGVGSGYNIGADGGGLGGSFTVLFDDSLQNGANFWAAGSSSSGLSSGGDPVSSGAHSVALNAGDWSQAGLSIGQSAPSGEKYLQLEVYRPSGSSGSFIIRHSGWTALELTTSNNAYWTIDGQPGDYGFSADSWHTLSIDLDGLGLGSSYLNAFGWGKSGGNDPFYFDDVVFSSTSDSGGSGGGGSGGSGSALVFDQADASSYTTTQDAGSVSVSGNGEAVTLSGNSWKKFPLNYTVTADTTLRFTVDASDAGEILAIGLDNNNDFTDVDRGFQFGGSQTWAAAYQITPTYNAGSGSATYEINIGAYYTGAMTHLFFVGDDDSNASTSVTFSNIRVFEDSALVFDQADASSYTTTQDAGSVSVSGNGEAVTLSGNSWKKFPLNYTVTANTTLRFTVDASDAGEILAIGLDNNNDFTDVDRGFQFSGSQTWAAAYQITPSYSAGSGAATYEIDIGAYYTGAMTHLFFVGDDDSNGSTSVTFSNIQVFEN